MKNQVFLRQAILHMQSIDRGITETWHYYIQEDRVFRIDVRTFGVRPDNLGAPGYLQAKLIVDKTAGGDQRSKIGIYRQNGDHRRIHCRYRGRIQQEVWSSRKRPRVVDVSIFSLTRLVQEGDQRM